jgi:hypothetical protein
MKPLNGALTIQESAMSTRNLKVPPVDGIDLDFRPRSYFGPLPLEIHLIAKVTGQERREMLRARLVRGSSNYPAELQESTLDDDLREALGRMHPMLLGGEYLPPLEKNETETARISLLSVTADQISVRARSLGCRIAHRIVDEYPEDDPEDGTKYRFEPGSSTQPLTLRQLVAAIESACAGGIVWPILEMNANYGEVERLHGFVTVSSEFYPQLERYYDVRIEVWLAVRAAEKAADGRR